MRIRRVIKKMFRNLLIVTCLIAAVIAVLYIRVFPREIKSVRKYRELKTKLWHEPDLIEHFPEDIAPNATNSKLSYYPGFLQGGAHFQVRYQLPSHQIEELYVMFKGKGTKIFVGGNTNIHMNEENGMPTTSFYTSDVDGYEGTFFPDDYEIMILDEIPPEVPEGHSWNHGRSHGVAISKTKNEIIYWAELW